MADQPDREATRTAEQDLAIELQSRFLDQLATVSLGGAGLVISLAGTILSGSHRIWLPAAEFGLAALVAMAAQMSLIHALFDGKPIRKRARNMTAIIVLLIGMAVGSLAAVVETQGKARPAAAAASR